jgi:hypothetical protein
MKEMICLFNAIPSGTSCSLLDFATVLSKRVRSSGVRFFPSHDANEIDVRPFFGCPERPTLEPLPANLRHSIDHADNFCIDPCWFLFCNEDGRVPDLTDDEICRLAEFGHSCASRSHAVAEVQTRQGPRVLGPQIRNWAGVYVSLWMKLRPESSPSHCPIWHGVSSSSTGPDGQKFQRLLYAMGFSRSDHRGMNNFAWLWNRIPVERLVDALYDMFLLYYRWDELERLGVLDDPKSPEAGSTGAQ